MAFDQSNHLHFVDGLLHQLREAFLNQKDAPRSQELLLQIKLELVQFSANVPEDVKKRQLLISREALEIATLLSVHLEDEESCERHISQLKPYYYDFAHLIPESERQWPILGLYLLLLLSKNRMAEFHTELELIPIEHQESPYIRYPRLLEQYWMEGSYNKVLRAAHDVPLPYYAFFMNILTETVREKAADCSEKAYESLPVQDAAALMNLDSAEKLHTFAQKRGWQIRDNTIYFCQEDKSKNLDIPSHRLVNELLSYAHELERIV